MEDNNFTPEIPASIPEGVRPFAAGKKRGKRRGKDRRLSAFWREQKNTLDCLTDQAKCELCSQVCVQIDGLIICIGQACQPSGNFHPPNDAKLGG